ncbi:MAG TPA: biotin--[acetyl-CoA-carboxylase] ligase [Acidobacteriaceae bacterium]|jgi:BirA family biotin operon repressor/biotin-[acetyl-CoA-carboxylase] ligase|nr:biotin--[acetyl-CoA-carboxylase] ligase [Acidobacteriaceae bacterium]
MREKTDTIDPVAVARALELTALAGPVLHLPVTESTNELALRAAQAGAARGVWVADQQMAGRGRGGHRWHSARGDGLYVSVLVTPELPLEQALWLSLATGLAAQQAILQVASVRIDLRWPNDLMLQGRKLGGILVESTVANAAASRGAMLRYAVLGIGINVHHAEFPAEIAPLATSLRVEGAEIDRQSLLIALLRALDREMDLLDREHAGVIEGPGVLARFDASSSWTRGRRVHVPEGGGYTGLTAGLNQRGYLLVDAEDGQRRTVLSGGVRDL